MFLKTLWEPERCCWMTSSSKFDGGKVVFQCSAKIKRSIFLTATLIQIYNGVNFVWIHNFWHYISSKVMVFTSEKNTFYKFHILWEGHKIWKNIFLTLLETLKLIGRFKNKIFCGLIRMFELYINNIVTAYKPWHHCEKIGLV